MDPLWPLYIDDNDGSPDKDRPEGLPVKAHDIVFSSPVRPSTTHLRSGHWKWLRVVLAAANATFSKHMPKISWAAKSAR